MTGNPYNCKENLTKKTLNISIGVFCTKIFLYEIFLQNTICT